MNLSLKGMLGVAALLTAGTLSAQTITLNTLEDWGRKPGQDIVTLKDGVFTVKKNTFMQTAKKFDVDPSKTYTLKASAKTDGTETSRFYLGFNLFDKNGKPIYCGNVTALPGTDTELVEDAKKGDTKIKVKDASKWQKRTWYAIALNTDPSYSDLPNRQLQNTNPSEIVQEGDVWVVTLTKPLTANISAGTKLRQHSHGGYMYTGGSAQLTNDWKNFAGSATGSVKRGYPSTKFAPGVAKVAVIMLVNWGNPKAESQIKDISLEIK